MSVASRCVFVPAAVIAVISMAGASSAVAGTQEVHTAAQQRVGTAAIAHETSRNAATMLMHLQQQLTRVTGVPEPCKRDIETLTLALDAARTRPVKEERIVTLAEALATALGKGTYEEVTIQRLAEDLYAVLNNKALTAEQAALVAVDVVSTLQDAGALEPHVTLVLEALQGVCPTAIVPPDPTAGKPGSPDQKTPAKRSLLTLSRDSSSD